MSNPEALAALDEVVSRIEMQDTCDSMGAPGCTHDGCAVRDSLTIAKDVRSRFVPQLCGARFLVERLTDPEQDARLVCVHEQSKPGHEHTHINAARDFRWTGPARSVAHLVAEANQ